MKLCPQCEFIYEDDQKFCDMDGQELVHDPKRAFTDITAALPSLSQVLKGDHAATPVTKIHIPLPPPSPILAPSPSPVANAAAVVPAKRSAGWQPLGLAIAALAGLALVALLFVVYYARTHQSQTRKANRSSSQTAGQFDDQSRAGGATHSAAQSAAPVAADSTTPLDAAAAAPEQTLEPAPSDQAANHAESTETPLQTSSSLANGSDKSASRARQTSGIVAAGASSDNNRAPVIIRLNNGASIKADEAWEKKEGVWYRQAGMVTFLKRSRVRSIQRPAATRSQTEPKAGTSIAQNQPRVGKPAAANPKKDSKVTSFLKTTGRVLRKPFRL
jgi:hypothetical protein